MTHRLWFLNGLLTVGVAHDEGRDGISVLEHLAPHEDSPPLHVHRDEDEIFHILEGELRIHVGDDVLRAGPGETLLAPQGVPHSYVVESEQARWLVTTARGNFERFARSISRPAERDGLPERAPEPTPEQMEALATAARANKIDIIGPPLT
jgi:mannose-6-phosphate isomerase-like protein (cupin superfamily)